jgi:hypothetical protein
MSERQLLCEKNIYPPLVMYAEGGTTNGTSLLKFKKGAFIGLNSVQPVCIRYDSLMLNMEMCIIPMYSHIVLCGSNPYCSIKVRNFPTFRPNDFFFENHQKEGEEKW